MSVNNGNGSKGRGDVPGDLIGLGEATRVGPHPDRGKRQRSTILRWIMSGRIRGWRSHGRWLVSRAELEAFLKPVLADVPLRQEAEARAEAVARAEETDAILRKHGIR